jgi:hypothetical protein
LGFEPIMKLYRLNRWEKFWRQWNVSDIPHFFNKMQKPAALYLQGLTGFLRLTSVKLGILS